MDLSNKFTNLAEAGFELRSLGPPPLPQCCLHLDGEKRTGFSYSLIAKMASKDYL